MMFNFVIDLLLNILLFIIIILLVVVVCLISVYNMRPVWLIHLYNRYRSGRAGLVKQVLTITEDLKISYLERKSQHGSTTLLFVHGFTSDKYFFCDLVRKLPPKFHLILIDLPAHGESTPNDLNTNYYPSTYVDCLHKFVKAYGLGDKKFHLVGSSLGGAVVGLYAAEYGGDSLSSVIMLSPACIRSPVLSTFLETTRDNLQNGSNKNVLIPNTLDEFYEMLGLIAYRKVNIPRQLAKGFIESKRKMADVHRKGLRDLNTEDEYLLLDGRLGDINHPVLCVWGKNDKVLDVSGSDVVRERVKNVEVHVLDRCGHAIILDRPWRIAKIITPFLEKFS